MRPRCYTFLAVLVVLVAPKTARGIDEIDIEESIADLLPDRKSVV